MNRPGIAVELRREREAHAASCAQIGDLLLRQRLDRALLVAGIRRCGLLGLRNGTDKKRDQQCEDGSRHGYLLALGRRVMIQNASARRPKRINLRHARLTAESFSLSLDIEYVQYRAIWCRLTRASRHRRRQQAFQFFQVAKLGPNIFEMMRGNLADLPAGGFFRTPEPEQGADFIERKSQLAGTA